MPCVELSRQELNRDTLGARILGGFWVGLDVRQRTGSTNVDLAAAAEAGAPEGSVLVAEAQDAGRGRAGRSWVSPPGAGLTFSVLLRPAEVPRERWGWVPLLAGAALASSVAAVAGVETWLKWPNDLLAGADRKKTAGLLAEVAGDAVVLGIGLNVTLTEAELPPDRPDTTSLALAGATVTDRAELLPAVLNTLAEEYESWRWHGGDAASSGLLDAYRRRCDTLGRDVRVDVPAGDPLHGRAVDIDADGRLVVDTASGRVAVAAGDVIHVRPRDDS
ncbi:BirA family transcriptional regulator, biotin operon repressor / biotin-[acetyl-CoA-carboxylase] ligase [Cryptosporangium aurantiacum]|uniref:biotin--[biotin carboxyl-carrier protein] ligase n=1 Tax=Cryptosporangium aurantiacum TaxID=134849 RepID=A0A1M7RGT6_9ACTN|nr:BirA family transcriptional regulator, biotin operon repressor / biotin-[acetyl-CoA-carboxylase] ligase [Cryptosporangium aurantiacum]